MKTARAEAHEAKVAEVAARVVELLKESRRFTQKREFAKAAGVREGVLDMALEHLGPRVCRAKRGSPWTLAEPDLFNQEPANDEPF